MSSANYRVPSVETVRSSSSPHFRGPSVETVSSLNSINYKVPIEETERNMNFCNYRVPKEDGAKFAYDTSHIKISPMTTVIESDSSTYRSRMSNSSTDRAKGVFTALNESEEELYKRLGILKS